MFRKVIRDNVYGDIIFEDKVLFELIQAPEFQRLRRIIQLGGGQFAFPGANHSRFSHCIGTYHIAKRFLENESLSLIPNDEKLEVQIAALLHDIGHGPFSHSFEKVNKQNHEKYTTEIIESEFTNINKILVNYKINVKNICNIINGTHKNKILNLLVSSQLDCDRIDYLERDALQANVNYTSLDVEWIIRHAEIIEDKIVYPVKVVPAIEAYLLGRYHMYQQIYNHKVSIVFDVMLINLMKRIIDLGKENYNFKNYRINELLKSLYEDKPLEIKQYLELDDYTFLEIFKTCIYEEDKILSDLASRIVNRNFFDGYTEDEIAARDFLAKNNMNTNYYLAEFDIKHTNLYVPYSEMNLQKKDETIYIKLKNSDIVPLEDYSTIISKIISKNDKQEQKIFIFCKK